MHRDDELFLCHVRGNNGLFLGPHRGRGTISVHPKLFQNIIPDQVVLHGVDFMGRWTEGGVEPRGGGGEHL